MNDIPLESKYGETYQQMTTVSSFPLVAEVPHTEGWARLGEVSHKSHPGTGLLQDSVFVPKLQNSILSHAIEAHCSSGPSIPALIPYMVPTKTISLEFPFLQEVAFKEK